MEIVGSEIKFKYRFLNKDKYGRAMFEVDDERLRQLFQACLGNGLDEPKKVSLFYSDEGELILITSNYSGETLENKRVICKEYKGAIRFYVKDNWRTIN